MTILAKVEVEKSSFQKSIWQFYVRMGRYMYMLALEHTFVHLRYMFALEHNFVYSRYMHALEQNFVHLRYMLALEHNRVKSGIFGQQVNSDSDLVGFIF